MVIVNDLFYGYIIALDAGSKARHQRKCGTVNGFVTILTFVNTNGTHGWLLFVRIKLLTKLLL